MERGYNFFFFVKQGLRKRTGLMRKHLKVRISLTM